MGYNPTSHNMASSFVRVCALVRIRNDLASLLSSLYARRHPQMSAPSKARDRTFVEYSLILISLYIIGCTRKVVQESPQLLNPSTHCAVIGYAFRPLAEQFLLVLSLIGSRDCQVYPATTRTTVLPSMQTVFGA